MNGHHCAPKGSSDLSLGSQLAHRRGLLGPSALDPLLLGSDFDKVTILHYAENCARLPDKRVIRRTDKVLSGSTVIDVVIEEFDTSESVVSSMPANYFAQITQEFVNAGDTQTGIVGHARAVLFRARELVQFAIDKMEREFGT